MTVDFRATVATDLGVCISGDVGSNHIGDGSGLIKTSGRLLMDGILNPARGTPANLVIVRQQLGLITAFPKPMYVLRALPNVIERTTEIEIGCKLTLMEGLKRKELYKAWEHEPPNWVTVPVYIPFGDFISSQRPENQYQTQRVAVAANTIRAQSLLEYCLEKIDLELSDDSANLDFVFLRSTINLDSGYVQIIGDLIRSETKFGRIMPDGKLQIRGLNFQLGRLGPVLTTDNLFSIEAIDGAVQPPDEYTVQYNGAEANAQYQERKRLNWQGWVDRPFTFSNSTATAP
jgi:hypothetical protein